MLPRRIATHFFWKWSYFSYRAKTLPKLIEKKRSLKRLNVVFLVTNVSMWKFDGLFRLLKKHSRFRPIAVSAMRPNESIEEQRADQAQMEAFFKKCGFEFYRGFDFEKRIWAPLETLNADILFYTQPYTGIVVPEYCFLNQKNVLFCYLPYAFETTTEKWTYNNPFQNFAWRIFLPSIFHLQDAQNISDIHAKNCIVSGYPTADEYSKTSDIQTKNVWKKTLKKCKKIIWAPHHSVEDVEMFGSSSFLEYYEVMFDIAEKRRDHVVFAFKPHPMLLTKLYKIWGKEKADAYYARWENLENAFFVSGEYRDLFIDSEALIHDCGSFTVEYLYTGKPTLFLFRKNRTANESHFGKLALKMHYHAHSREDIERFIKEIVLGENDPKEKLRERFYQKYLRPPNGQSAAQNILDEIERELGWKS